MSDAVREDLPNSIAPDLLGHGTAVPMSQSTVETHADRLPRMLEADVVLVGQSLGGMVTVELVARSPVQIRALVMVEAVSTVRDTWGGALARNLRAPSCAACR